MPTYQYKREDGSIFEVFQSMNDAALTHCPETGQAVQRVITGGGGVVYKGTGWYVTDYKNNSGGRESANANKDEGTSSGSESLSAAKGKDGTSSPAESSSSQAGSSSSQAGSSTT